MRGLNSKVGGVAVQVGRMGDDVARDSTSTLLEKFVIPLLAVWRGTNVIGAVIFWLMALAAVPGALAADDLTLLLQELALPVVATIAAVGVWWAAGKGIEAAEKAARTARRASL